MPCTGSSVWEYGSYMGSVLAEECLNPVPASDLCREVKVTL